MKTYRTIEWIVALVLSACGYALAQETPPALPAEDQPEVLTAGPVNEAFAEPVPLKPEAGLMVSKEPPAAIEETPPADRPVGDPFVWVPGYWSWDRDRADFLWVSGCWRAGPPNTVWVPGYWAPVYAPARTGVNVTLGPLAVHVGKTAPPVVTGWQWVAGFWAPADGREIEYLPVPPAAFDLEPIGTAPSADCIWVPGCSYWRDGSYIRRAGYWLHQPADWVWVPTHYTWTPRGYVMIAGHWDYPLERRGVLFAPVYFSPALVGRPGLTFCPSVAIDLPALQANLFVYPAYCHYYFGDYYDSAYLAAGIIPFYRGGADGAYFDPIFAYERCRLGHNGRDWTRRLRDDYETRRIDPDLRPARTFRDMQFRMAGLPVAKRKALEMGRPITRLSENAGPLKFQEMKAPERKKFGQTAAEMRTFRQERLRIEGAGTPALRTTGQTGLAATPREGLAESPRVTLPKTSPILGKSVRSEKIAPPITPVEEHRSDSTVIDRKGHEREERGRGK